MSKQIKVGSMVEFKSDIEGFGVVAAIHTRSNRFFGTESKTFLVKSVSEPNGYPFHPMARWSDEVKAMVVYLDEDQIWLAEEEVEEKVSPKVEPIVSSSERANYRAIYTTTKEHAGSKRFVKASSAKEAAELLGVYALWIGFKVTIQISDGKKWTTVTK